MRGADLFKSMLLIWGIQAVLFGCLLWGQGWWSL